MSPPVGSRADKDSVVWSEIKCGEVGFVFLAAEVGEKDWELHLMLL